MVPEKGIRVQMILPMFSIVAIHSEFAFLEAVDESSQHRRTDQAVVVFAKWRVKHHNEHAFAKKRLRMDHLPSV